MSLSDQFKQQAIPQFRNVYIRINDLEQISRADAQDRATARDAGPGNCATVKYILACAQARAKGGKHPNIRDPVRMPPSPPGYFAQALERELDRVRRFVETFGEEVWVSLGSITETVGKWQSNLKSPKKIMEDSIPSSTLDQLQQECEDIGDNVILLDEFLRQNVIASAFLAQKHDMACQDINGRVLKSLGQVSPAYLQAMENYLMAGVQYDPILTGLSDAYSKIRQVRHRAEGGDAVWCAPDKFERKTTKYWVHPADVLRLKCQVIKNLPILIYGKDKEKMTASRRLSSLKEQSLTDWTLISSVYFDNKNMDTYHERLRREHGASLVRFRWYGKQRFGPNETIFVERKVHKDSWTGEKSVKERSPMSAPQVEPFIHGELVPSLKEETSQADLLKDIQNRIVTRNEEPNLRTEYRRIAFQESNSNEVRMSLDTHLRMIREREAPRSKGEWCRDMRFRVDDKDVIHFPYAVFEIKLCNEEPPDWVQNILDSGILVEVPKFSKFLHGSALLFGEDVHNTPFWFVPSSKGLMTPATLEEMAETSDKYQEESSSFMIPSPYTTRNQPAPSPAPESSSHKMQVSTVCSVPNHSTVLSEVVVMPSKSNSQRQVLRTAIQDKRPPPVHQQSTKLRKVHLTVESPESDVGSEYNKGQKRGIRRLLPWNWGASKCPKGDLPLFDPDKGTHAARAAALVRTRIEPKTFFANERTFLSWLTIAVMVMFMGLSLLDGSSLTSAGAGGAGHAGAAGSSRCIGPDGTRMGACNASKMSGALIAPVALILMAYSLYMYRKRTIQILRRETVRYDDQRGPIILTVLLVTALIVAYIISVKYSF